MNYCFCVRFDYTPALPETDTAMVSLPVARMYELTRDIYQLLYRLLREYDDDRCTELTDCCLRLMATGDTALDLSKLRQSVAVARQHYQQQVPLFSESAGAMSREQTELLRNSVKVARQKGSDGADVEVTELIGSTTADSSCRQSPSGGSSSVSFETLYICQCIDQLNRDYDSQSDQHRPVQQRSNSRNP